MRIELESKKYKKGPEVLRKENFNFEQNGLYTIIGPSGVGKTTLLNIITGLDFDYIGKCYFDDQIIAKKKKQFDNFRLSNIGYIFQDGLLFESLTVKENLKIALKHLKLSNDEINTAINAQLESLNLLEYKQIKVNKLSGGQRQRVGIARALLTNPSYIIADEPTASLDEENKIIVMDILKQLSKSKVVIVVSHDEIVEEYADVEYKFDFLGNVTKTQINPLGDKVTIRNLKTKKFNISKYFKLLGILLRNKTSLIAIAIVSIVMVFITTFIFAGMIGSTKSITTDNAPNFNDNAMTIANTCSMEAGYEGYGGKANQCSTDDIKAGAAYNPTALGQEAIDFIEQSPEVANYYVIDYPDWDKANGTSTGQITYGFEMFKTDSSFFSPEMPSIDQLPQSYKNRGGSGSGYYEPQFTMLPETTTAQFHGYDQLMKEQIVVGEMPSEYNDVVISTTFAANQFGAENYNNVIGETIEYCLFDHSTQTKESCIDLNVTGVYEPDEFLGDAIYAKYSNEMASFMYFGDTTSQDAFTTVLIEFEPNANKEQFITDFKAATGIDQLTITDQTNQVAINKELSISLLKTFIFLGVIIGFVLFIITSSLVRIRFKSHHNTFVLLRTIGYKKIDIFFSVFGETVIINVIIFTVALLLTYVVTNQINAQGLENWLTFGPYAGYPEYAATMFVNPFIIGPIVVIGVYFMAIFVAFINAILATWKTFRKDITTQISED